MRLAFYVSGNATRLRKLIAKRSFVIDHVRLVVNDGAQNYDLENELLSTSDVEYVAVSYDELQLRGKARNEYLSELLLTSFARNKIDYCITLGGKLLCGRLLEEYKNKLINVHPSILPAFPGLSAIDAAMANNAFLLGNTIHFIDEGVDTGPVIMQSVIHSSMVTNYDDVLDLQIPMIEQVIKWLAEDRIRVVGRRVEVEGADYSKIAFVPVLE